VLTSLADFQYHQVSCFESIFVLVTKDIFGNQEGKNYQQDLPNFALLWFLLAL